MSKNVQATVTTHDDGTFVRTAIVVPEEGESITLVSEDGEKLALINAFIYFDPNGKINHIIVDVIDNDKRFDKRQAMVFVDGKRTAIASASVVCADFRSTT